MEEFIAEIQNNAKINTEKRNKGSYRSLFLKLLEVSPDINIIEKHSDEGDIIFEVPMKNLGLSSFEDIVRFKKEISSEFASNFIGELLVRENLHRFAKIITELKEEYSLKVNKFNHSRFGMKIYRDKFIFSFHMSLIQKILTEDFKREII